MGAISALWIGARGWASRRPARRCLAARSSSRFWRRATPASCSRKASRATCGRGRTSTFDLLAQAVGEGAAVLSSRRHSCRRRIRLFDAVTMTLVGAMVVHLGLIAAREPADAEPDAPPCARRRRHPPRPVRPPVLGRRHRRRRPRADRRRARRRLRAGVVALGAVLALAGSFAWEYVWVEAGQSVPLHELSRWHVCNLNRIHAPVAPRPVALGRLRRLRVDQLAEEGPPPLLDHSERLLQLRVGVRHPRLRRQGTADRPQDRRQPAAPRQPRPHLREGRRHAESAGGSGPHPLPAASATASADRASGGRCRGTRRSTTSAGASARRSSRTGGTKSCITSAGPARTATRTA